jgi:hypothetical protein
MHPLNLAKAAFWQLFYPSVKTDGNESEKRLFIAVRYLVDGAGSIAPGGFSQNQQICDN